MKVYVLELEHGKYYVGKTRDVARRFQQHLSGLSSIWTRMFKPMRIINIIHDCDGLDEDRITVKYMICLLYTSPSPRDLSTSRMPSSA